MDVNIHFYYFLCNRKSKLSNNYAKIQVDFILETRGQVSKGFLRPDNTPNNTRLKWIL